MPNAISAVRIALIVVFAVLLASGQDGWAIATLAAAGVSDFLDGFLARRWGQVTTLGRMLDPAADRLLTVAMVVGLASRGIVPWWLVGVLLARDVMVATALLIAHRRGVRPPEVTFVGKSATAALYVFLPGAYLAWVAAPTIGALHTVAIVGATAASLLYWVAGLGYVADLRARSASKPRDTPGDVPSPGPTGLG